MVCWVIYQYKNRLGSSMAMRFTGDTYAEIQSDAREWLNSRENIEAIDVTESVMEEDD